LLSLLNRNMFLLNQSKVPSPRSKARWPFPALDFGHWTLDQLINSYQRIDTCDDRVRIDLILVDELNV
jgi:hypothetical protein